MMLDAKSWALLTGWAGYYLLHSLLAANGVKHFLFDRFPDLEPKYRLGYSLFATFCLFPLLLVQATVPINPAWELPLMWRMLGILPILAALWIFRLAFNNYDIHEFLGTKHLPDKASTLQVSGINQYVRHPLYFGGILILISYLFWFPGIFAFAFAALTCTYLWIGSGWEEKKLIRLYGNSYREYQRKVRRIIPFLI